VPDLVDLSAAEMLITLDRKYTVHKLMLRWAPKMLFKYLDKYYTPKKNCPSTLLVAYQVFKEKVFTKMDKGIQSSVLDLVYRDREGEQPNTNLIKTVVGIFCDVGMRQVPQAKTRGQIAGVGGDSKKPTEEVTLDTYEQEFEVDFLKNTREYYQRKSQKWTEEDSFPDYMRKAEDLYNKERVRCQTYLHHTTEPKLLEAIDSELIGAYQLKLLNNPGSGFKVLLQSYTECGGKDDEDVSRLYSLFVRLPATETSGLQPVATMLQDFITQAGNTVLEQCKGDNSDKLVEKLVEKYNLFHGLCKPEGE
jgi:cullin 1